jgi:hypothetical protein
VGVLCFLFFSLSPLLSKNFIIFSAITPGLQQDRKSAVCGEEKKKSAYQKHKQLSMEGGTKRTKTQNEHSRKGR